MSKSWLKQRNAVQKHFLRFLGSPAALAFLPAACLAAFWFGGEGALIVLAALLPIMYLIGSTAHDRYNSLRRASKGMVECSAFQDVSDAILKQARKSGRDAVLLALSIDDFEKLAQQHGNAAAQSVIGRVSKRLLQALRTEDCVTHEDEGRFLVCTEPVRHLDLELCIQLASRLQETLEEPIRIDGVDIYVSTSIGFCQSGTVLKQGGLEWISAAFAALQEAQTRGPSAVRAFSDRMRLKKEVSRNLQDEISAALDGGQIYPWFQPQISTDTGRITGFEALARWSHPDRGMISPAEFLPAVESSGQLERLAEKMMQHSFAALTTWDQAGVDVPRIGINFAGSELSNPKLVERIRWELDRFDLTPNRLAVEVLETVVAGSPEDTISRNINALGKMGCRIDLDDFGTGHASISSIRRFSVSRIKIDRSFVMKADKDPEQQRMIAAILTMAERLQVETLAEGVETVGEHVLLAQLGCDHVQGYGIARPMPLEQTLGWIHRHNSKLQEVPSIVKSKSG